MKKLLLLCSAALVLSAPAAFAQVGLNLTWANCVLETAQTDINYTNCNTTAVTIRLFGVLKVPRALPGFIGVAGILDLQQEDVTPLDRFWRYDATANGGCNQTGIGFAINADDLGLCAGETLPWGPGGGGAGASNTGYIAGFNGVPNRGRQFFAVTRDASDPFPLNPAINYYIVHVNLNTNNRATCAGCTGKVAIVWNSCEMIENDNTRTFITGPDILKGQNCATINHALPATCAATPTRKTTWGQLKSIYR